MNRVVLEVGHTWDGQPLEITERGTVCFHADNSHLVVKVDAPFHDDPAHSGPPGSLWKLWQWEVVELFIATTSESYTEIELGPHGHFLVLTFKGARNIVSHGHQIQHRAERHGGRWRGQALVSLALIPDRPWRVNAYAIHGHSTQRRYLAAEPVPGPRPDYHQLQCFRWV